MKHCFILLLSLCLTSCSKHGEMLLPRKKQQSDIHSLYSVTLRDVQDLAIKETLTKTKNNNAELSIIPIVDCEYDTLLYVVNYSDGWRIISSDKRTPPDVAYSQTGTIDIQRAGPSFLAWLKTAARDMKTIKREKNTSLRFSEEEINHHLNKWKGGSSRWVDPNLPIDEILVIDTLDYTEPVDIINHLAPAHWDQCYPYNQYCPILTEETHYYVGCASVAGGSLLHYLYKINNYPSSFRGVPMDSLGVNYSSVSTDSVKVTARYLKSINDSMNMVYLPSGSFAFPSDVIDFFNEAGYSCSYSGFDPSIIRSSLLNNNIVMVIAFDNILDIIDLPSLSSGHYFLIDGYQTRRQVICKRTYCISPSGNPIPNSEFLTYLYIGDPYLAYVKMNWGWWTQWESGLDDGWYALTSSWITSEHTYDYGRHMFYDFELL